MGNRLSKIVTKTGDRGLTGLADGSRRAKSDNRIHCIGEVDELNSVTGLISGFSDDQDVLPILTQIQHDLFDLGAELSQPDKTLFTKEYVEFLEEKIALYNADLPPLKEFILPGGSSLMGFIHLARTVCRRAERHFTRLQQQQKVNPFSLMYLNRLSDLFFILARYMAVKSGQKETCWQSNYARIKRSG